MRQVKPTRRKDGSYVRFDENAVILEKGKKELLARRLGPIPREVAEAGFKTIASRGRNRIKLSVISCQLAQTNNR